MLNAFVHTPTTTRREVAKHWRSTPCSAITSLRELRLKKRSIPKTEIGRITISSKLRSEIRIFLGSYHYPLIRSEDVRIPPIFFFIQTHDQLDHGG